METCNKHRKYAKYDRLRNQAMKKEATDRVREIYEARRTHENITTQDEGQRTHENIAQLEADVDKRREEEVTEARTHPVVYVVQIEDMSPSMQRRWKDVNEHKTIEHAREEKKSLENNNPMTENLPEYRIVRREDRVVK